MTTTPAHELSAQLRAKGHIDTDKWQALLRSLTDEQTQRIKDKARWEGCSWLGVLIDWPDLFEAAAHPPRQ